MRGRAEVHRLKQRLEAAFSRAPLPSADSQVQADFAKYLCVLVSGFLEKAISSLLIGHAEEKACPDVASFVEATLDRWQNAKSEKLLTLLGSFDKDWRKSLEGTMGEDSRDAVDSVIALRHKIAHGGDVGITLSQMRSYYGSIKRLVDQIADVVEPFSGPPPNKALNATGAGAPAR